MEKSSQIHLSPAAFLLAKEGILPAGVQKTYGINTYKELETVIKAGEYVVDGEEETPSQTELDLQHSGL